MITKTKVVIILVVFLVIQDILVIQLLPLWYIQERFYKEYKKAVDKYLPLAEVKGEKCNLFEVWSDILSLVYSPDDVLSFLKKVEVNCDGDKDIVYVLIADLYFSLSDLEKAIEYMSKAINEVKDKDNCREREYRDYIEYLKELDKKFKEAPELEAIRKRYVERGLRKLDMTGRLRKKSESGSFAYPDTHPVEKILGVKISTVGSRSGDSKVFSYKTMVVYIIDSDVNSRAGNFKIGDIILSYGGKEIGFKNINVDDIDPYDIDKNEVRIKNEIMEMLEKDGEIKLRISRDGEILDKDIKIKK